jgi:thiol-disulfide isomerase/thioredoxin
MFAFLKKPSVRNGMSLLIILAIIGTVVYLYKTRIELFTSPSGKKVPLVTYYYLPKCPYCVAFNDEWSKFEATADAALMQFEKIDGSDPNKKDKITDENISGYPTIRIKLPDNSKIDYKGERTADALIDYVSKL